MSRLLVLFPAFSLLAGCIPFPHTRQHLPRVYQRNPCEEPGQTAITDVRGSFGTPGQRRLAFFVPLLPIHSMDSWAAALLSADGPLGYIRRWNYRAGPRYSPREVEMHCDLAART